MQNLLQSSLKKTAGIIGGAAAIIVILGSGDGLAGGIGNLGQLILVLIGLPIGIALAIAVMVGIFFAAVGMADCKQAVIFWKGLKGSCPCSCSSEH